MRLGGCLPLAVSLISDPGMGKTTQLALLAEHLITLALEIRGLRGACSGRQLESGKIGANGT